MVKILNQIDDFFISINENKTVLLLILVLLGIYAIHFNLYLVENTINLFDNKVFRLIVFISITYISSSSPAIGIGLAIIMLASMQIITNIKFKKEFDDFNDFNDV